VLTCLHYRGKDGAWVSQAPREKGNEKIENVWRAGRCSGWGQAVLLRIPIVRLA